MAINEWRGDSQPVAMRDRFTVGGTAQAGDTLVLTRNLKQVTYELTGDDTLETAAENLAAAYAAATFPESKEATAEYTDGDDFLDLVAATAGVPFGTWVASVTGGGATTTLTKSSVTASAGPNHADDVDNWTLGLPDAADDLVIAGGESLLYGLGTMDFTTCDVRASFENSVGLPKWNEAGYWEDRERAPTFNGATVYIGRGPGNGSSRIFYKAVAASSHFIYKTGNRESERVPAVDIGATGNPTIVHVFGTSDVGILVEDESTARTIADVKVSGEDARVTFGRRLTVTNHDHDTGTTESYGVNTTAVVNRGLYIQYEGSLNTITAYPGTTVRMLQAGTVASVTGKGVSGSEGPIFDCEGNSLARTFTASSFTGGAVLYDENKSVTLGGGTHTADTAFFTGSRLGPTFTWSRT